MLKKLLLFLVATVCFAALPSSTVWEVRNGGNDSNGGCFDSAKAGTDYSQQAANQYTFSDLASSNGTNASPQVTSASHNFVAADVGNCLHVSAGTNWTTGWYEIVSASANAATLDRAVGSAASLSSGTFFVGGALKTLSQLNTNMCSGCIAWVMADSNYNITAKITFNFSNSLPAQISGYTSSRGDNGKPTIFNNSNLGDRMMDLNTQNSVVVRNFIFDLNSQTSTTCFRFLGASEYAENIECKNQNNSTTSIDLNNVRDECRYCYVHDSTIAGSVFSFDNDDDICIYCTARAIAGNSAIGFNFNTRGHCYYCIVDTLSGTTADAFEVSPNAGPVDIDHCVVYNPSRDAIRITNVQNNQIKITNCVFSTAVNGINNTSGTTLRAGDLLNDYNFTYNMSGSAVVNLTAGSHSVALTADPFTSASTHDFSLNNTASGGKSVRAAGYSPTLPGTISTAYPDGGAVQHQDPAGGGGGNFVVAQ